MDIKREMVLDGVSVSEHKGQALRIQPQACVASTAAGSSKGVKGAFGWRVRVNQKFLSGGNRDFLPLFSHVSLNTSLQSPQHQTQWKNISRCQMLDAMFGTPTTLMCHENAL